MCILAFLAWDQLSVLVLVLLHALTSCIVLHCHAEASAPRRDGRPAGPALEHAHSHSKIVQKQGERLPAHYIAVKECLRIYQHRAVSEPCCLPLPQALSALFLMNNAHYQLKSVQASSSLNIVSHEWQDDCEAKVQDLCSNL